MNRVAIVAAIFAILSLPLVASAEIRVVHDTSFAYANLPYSTHTELKRVRFTLTVPSTVIITSQANLSVTSCTGSPCASGDRGQTFAYVYSGAKVPGSSSYVGGQTYAPAAMAITGGVSAAATGVSGLLPISVTHTAFNLPPGDYDAVTSGFSSGNDRALLRHYATTVLIIPNE